MELSERVFTANRDPDPCFLKYIFSQDFYDFCDLWINSIGEQDIIKAVEGLEPYSPIVEDISMDDEE